MSQQRGFAHLLLILLVVLIAGVIAYLFYTNNLPGFSKTKLNFQTSTEESSSVLKTEYQNPFEEKSSYTNPFSNPDYQNPFDNLSQ